MLIILSMFRYGPWVLIAGISCQKDQIPPLRLFTLLAGSGDVFFPTYLSFLSESRSTSKEAKGHHIWEYITDYFLTQASELLELITHALVNEFLAQYSFRTWW